MIPLEKQSKKAQRKFHSRYRRDWNGVKPTTRVVKSKKIYNRKKLQKQSDGRLHPTEIKHLRAHFAHFCKEIG